MNRRSSSRLRQSAAASSGASLDEGTLSGLKRLVQDNATTVASMLEVGDDDSKAVDKLCEKCASVIRQQQLSPASFLARFFDVSILSEHSKLLGKSAKGSVPILSERIAAEWKRNKPLPGQEAVAATTATDSSKKDAVVDEPKKKGKKNKRVVEPAAEDEAEAKGGGDDEAKAKGGGDDEAKAEDEAEAESKADDKAKAEDGGDDEAKNGGDDEAKDGEDHEGKDGDEAEAETASTPTDAATDGTKASPKKKRKRAKRISKKKGN